MPYIPPQLQVDQQQDDRFRGAIQLAASGMGQMGQARLDAVKLEKQKAEAATKEKQGKAEAYMKDGASSSAIKKFMSGDATDVENFYSQKYKDKSETDRIAAGSNADFKKAQINKLNQEASEPKLTPEQKAALNAEAKNKYGQPAQNEFAAAGYAKRAKQAEDDFAKLPKGTGTDWKARISGFLPNELVSENLQSLDQAKRNFISANLRKESGAAIPPDEMRQEEIKYFPQPGDSDAVIAQKARSREQARLNLEAEGARAMPRIQDAQVAPVDIQKKVQSYTPEQLAQRRAELERKAQMMAGQ